MTAAVLQLSLDVSGQNATFYESFDDTPLGEVPEGWKWYSLGGGSGNNWIRSTYGFFGPKVMTSGVEYALPGQIDEDWLVTPQITPAYNDYLIFDSGQELLEDLGSTFEVRISTASSNRSDFTETLAIWNETEFPRYIYKDRLFLDLSAYQGIPIYIAFVHKNPVTGESEDPDFQPPTENWYLDNVWVRPMQQMQFNGAEIFGAYTNVVRLAYSKTTIIMGLIVRAAGDNGTANITSLTFTTPETSPLIKIKEAKLYTTYDVSFISTIEDEGVVDADIFGTVTDPESKFVIEGDQVLEQGDTYFWLVYTLEANENDLIYPFPEVGTTFEKVVVNGEEYATLTSSITVVHPIVPRRPVNDNYADAIELQPSSIPARYGSYNYRATYETEFERLAYCSGESRMDGSNSVWWHFKAPANGMITVDLSDCDFNTLLLIQDKNLDQLACSKDIDELSQIFQSRISNFEVVAGSDYYIRVTGEAAGPDDPNAANGVIHMDFSFNTPVGVESPHPMKFIALYPNPSNGIVYTDLFLERPAKVVLNVIDIMGRVVHSSDKGSLTSGSYERLPLDVSHLPSGTYSIVVQGSPRPYTGKILVIAK